METTAKHIHFIGIGGIGMSALARHYVHEGWQVSGSDTTKSRVTEALEALGVSVVYEQTAENLTEPVDLVVYTEAVKKDNAELVAAQTAGIETINYFAALGRVANEYYLIAVAGTHGKSTTTAMLVDVLEEAGLDPTAVVGSLRSKTGSNYRAGKSKYMVVEACEYKRDFLSLQPDVLIITNIEHEHVDYYKDLTDVQSAFRELVAQVSKEGVVITDTASAEVKPVIADVAPQVIDYRQYLDLSLRLTQPGLHNQLNAAAASAAAAYLGIEKTESRQALENFAGIWRRFEYKGEISGAPVYDDYSHHPTEIKAAIAGARERYPNKKLTVVYQPHTYSRTAELFDGFVDALALADKVILVPIYAAREDNETGVSSQQLVDALTARQVMSSLFETLDAAVLNVQETVTQDDVVIVMGAGDVTKVATKLVT
ncbi:MAG: Mur ligase domain-containing protein [Candidatus Paceibacterota bacterium]